METEDVWVFEFLEDIDFFFDICFLVPLLQHDLDGTRFVGLLV